MRKALLALLATIWIIFGAIGLAWLNYHSSIPGVRAGVSAKMPEGAFPGAKTGLPKLLLFVHPHCARSLL